MIGGHWSAHPVYIRINYKFSYFSRIHILYGLLRSVGCIFDLIVLYYAKDLKLLSDDKEDGDAKEPTTTNVDNKITKHEIVDIVASLEVAVPYHLTMSAKRMLPTDSTLDTKL